MKSVRNVISIHPDALLIRLVFILLIVSSSRALAQSPSLEDARNILIAGLPDSSESAGKKIDAASKSSFEPLLPDDLQSLVSKGQWEGIARKRLSFVWRYDDDWELKSAEAEEVTLDDSNSFASWPIPRSRLPFRNETIDRIQRGGIAAPILWNALVATARDEYTDSRALISLYENSELKRRMQLSLIREFPFSTEGANAKVVFREQVQVLTPPSIHALTWLTYRFIGAEEDAVWILSPVTGKVRQVTESNRGDPMFSGFVSVRDLLGYWGKIERGTSTLLGTEEFLVPFGATQILHAEQLADGCFSAEADGLPNAQDLPTFTRHSILIPRKLLAVEVLSTDPFSIHAREIVYFDSGTLLPVYRSIFNQAAELVRFIATSFALVSSEDKKFRRPIVVRQLIWEPAMDRIVTVQVDRHLICPPGASSSSRHILSPRALKVPEQVSEGE